MSFYLQSNFLSVQKSIISPHLDKKKEEEEQSQKQTFFAWSLFVFLSGRDTFTKEEYILYF